MLVSRPILIGGTIEDMCSVISSDHYLIVNVEPPLSCEQIHGESALGFWADIYWDLFFQNRVLPFSPSRIELDTHNKNISIKDASSEKMTIEFSGDVEVSSLVSLGITGADIVVSGFDYCVLDLFEVNQGSQHDMWQITTKDSLVNEIRFFITDRIDGNLKNKDFVSYSYLKDSEIREFEFSDTMVKFKAQDMLNETLKLDKPVRIKHVMRFLKKREFFQIKPQSPSVVFRRHSPEISKATYERIKSKYSKQKNK